MVSPELGGLPFSHQVPRMTRRLSIQNFLRCLRFATVCCFLISFKVAQALLARPSRESELLPVASLLSFFLALNIAAFLQA